MVWRIKGEDENAQMTYSPKVVPNSLLRKARTNGCPLTQMKLHKLLYYAHGWSLGINNLPLIDETVEAWKYGPVVRSLYYEFRDLGANAINRKATEFDPTTQGLITPEVDEGDDRTQRLLDRVWDVYGRLTAAQLSQMTHE